MKHNKQDGETEEIIEPTPGVMLVPEIGKKMEVTYNYLKHTSKDKFRQWMIRKFYKALVEELGNIKYDSILDVGCGEGFTLNKIAKINPGTSLAGIDNSTAAVNLGKKLFPRLDLKVGSIYRLPFSGNSKDLVLCTEVLEHLASPELALKQLTIVSRKYLLLSVPNEPIFSIRNLLMGKNIKRLGSSPSHLHRWSSRQFLNLVEKNGLKIKSVRHPFPFTLILATKPSRANNNS